MKVTMPKVQLGSTSLTAYGAHQVACSMFDRGLGFVGAAILLRQRGGSRFVVLHLLCQGFEIVQKGLLLAHDFKAYRPKLKTLGHNLVRGHDEFCGVYGLGSGHQVFRSELSALDNLYRHHLLRYGSGLDFFIDPETVAFDRVLRRLAAMIRFGHRVLKK